jgi:uncharacterized protein (DUF2062 family)
MLLAASKGILVKLVPVSIAMVKNTGLFFAPFPFIAISTIIKSNLGLSGNLSIYIGGSVLF